MALSQQQLDRVNSCAASARRAAGASQAEFDAAVANVLAGESQEGVRTVHRPAGALPGIASTFAELENGNKVVRVTGYSAGVTRTYGFTILAGE